MPTPAAMVGANNGVGGITVERQNPDSISLSQDNQPKCQPDPSLIIGDSNLNDTSGYWMVVQSKKR